MERRRPAVSGRSSPAPRASPRAPSRPASPSGSGTSAPGGAGAGEDGAGKTVFSQETSTLGVLTKESLYKTGRVTDRDRHRTAKYATISDDEYKAAANGISVGDPAAPGAKQAAGRASPSREAAVQLRRQARQRREADADHMSELLARRLQSVEVRQCGLDEEAADRLLNPWKALEADKAAALALLEQEEGDLERCKADAEAAEEAGAAAARRLMEEERRELARRQAAIEEAANADAEAARLLMEEEERDVARQRAAVEASRQADADAARKLMEEEEAELARQRAAVQAADLAGAEVARLMLEEDEAGARGAKAADEDADAALARRLQEELDQNGDGTVVTAARAPGRRPRRDTPVVTADACGDGAVDEDFLLAQRLWAEEQEQQQGMPVGEDITRDGLDELLASALKSGGDVVLEMRRPPSSSSSRQRDVGAAAGPGGSGIGRPRLQRAGSTVLGSPAGGGTPAATRAVAKAAPARTPPGRAAKQPNSLGSNR